MMSTGLRVPRILHFISGNKPVNPSQRVLSTLSQDQVAQLNAPTYLQASNNVLQQWEDTPDEITIFYRVLRRHTPSIELLNPIRLRTPGHQTINKELLPDLCQINKDFSVQGHSRYSSLAHALSRCVTPAHSPDQVGRSNAFAYPQSSHVSRDTFPVRDANPVHIGPQLVPLALSQNPATKIKAHTPHKAHACPNCKKKFQRRQELMRHLLSNSRTGSFAIPSLPLGR
ncbi:hypothetical protein BJV77DRAFT_1113063 [Russula vinacea]|nr:hypothetical protein BJV77DRAFT_1113063 [Russula vinacea]